MGWAARRNARYRLALALELGRVRQRVAPFPWGLRHVLAVGPLLLTMWRWAAVKRA